MHRQFVLMLLVGSCCFFGSGCANKQLQKMTIRQAKSVSETYEEQVLNNLAMYVDNPHAIPFFSVFSQGQNAVNDSARIAAGANAFTETFWRFVSADGTRQMNQGWTMAPVVDPNRLRLMQCAYQRAVGASPEYCQKCCEIEDDWSGKKDTCYDPCGITCGWLQVSTKWKDVPKCCRQKYGYHCGTYVWVEPCYEHELSKLVMKIVEYASGTKAAPSAPKTKEVRLYYNAKGEPATVADHATSIIATVPRAMTIGDIESELNPFTETTSQKILELEDKKQALQSATEDAEIMESIKNANSAKVARQGVKPFSSTNVKKARENALKELDDQINLLQQQKATKDTPSREFGPPTQFNNMYTPDVYQLQQRLYNAPLTPPN